MLHGFADLSDDDVRNGDAELDHVLDFHAREREQPDELRHIGREIDEFTEPVERDFHAEKKGANKDAAAASGKL